MKLINEYDVFERHHVSFDVIIKLLSPLSHIGESVGNQSNLKTISVTDLEGIPNKVFVYSGNALRNGVLRRKGVKAFLEKLDIVVKPEIHQTLFAGGYIDGGTGVDLELDKLIRQVLPPISVLGTAKPKGLLGAKDAQMIPGRMQIGDAVLVCFESLEYVYRYFPPVLPTEIIQPLTQIIEAKDKVNNDRIESWLHSKNRDFDDRDYRELLQEYIPFFEEKIRPYTQWLTWNQKVRMDSLKVPELKKFIRNNKQIEGGQASLFGDTSKPEKKEQKTQQFIMGDWLLQQGATLYSKWHGNLTDIEEGFLVDALLEFTKEPYLGGKSGTGCGLVSMDIYYHSENGSGNWLNIAPNTQLLSDRANKTHQRYSEYLQTYRNYLGDIESSSELKNLLEV